MTVGGGTSDCGGTPCPDGLSIVVLMQAHCVEP